MKRTQIALRHRFEARAGVALLLAGVLIATGCGGPRLGVVESRRVLSESVLALSMQRRLDEQERIMAADLRLLAGQLSPEDLEARRQIHLRDLQQLKVDLEEQLNTRIRQTVAEVAKERRLRVVLVKDVTRLGGIDVTDDVIERLK